MDATRMREWRKEVGLTQKEVAVYLGVDKQTVNRWEKGLIKIRTGRAAAFVDLITNDELVAIIKARRKPRIFGRPFTKNNS